MSEETCLTLLPENRTFLARKGDTLLDVALDHGAEMPHECGGNCACTTCHVHILEGIDNLSPMEDAELDRLWTAENRRQNSRLGCQALMQGGKVVARLVEEAAW